MARLRPAAVLSVGSARTSRLDLIGGQRTEVITVAKKILDGEDVGADVCGVGDEGDVVELAPGDLAASPGRVRVMEIIVEKD